MSTTGRDATTQLLRGGRSVDGRRIDLRLSGEFVDEVGSLAPRAGESVVDLAGWLVLGAFAEPHVHLDKAFTFDRARNAAGDLAGAMDGYSGVAAALRADDVRQRATAALRRFVAAGTTVVRAQVGCGPLSGVAAVEALAEVRKAVADVVDVQIVAHAAVPGDGRAHRALLRRAVEAGADAIGGNPFIEPDPDDALAACFEVAAEMGLPIDLHVDESTDPGVLTLPDVAAYARQHRHPVTAAHCVSLGSLPPAAARAVAEAVAAAGVGVVTLPLTNLYLQGRSGSDYGRRGLTAIDILRAAGVTVAAGADNIRDVFQPVGRCDPLEVAALLVTAAHQPVRTAAAMVGEDARRIVGLPPAGPQAGAAADLVALRVDTLDGAVAEAPADRLVWRRGRLVSRTETVSEVAI